MIDTLKEHSGKAATVAGGGLSIGLAFALFASKGEVDMLKQRLAEEHRDRMDSETQCVSRFSKLAMHVSANALTNVVAGDTTNP